MFRADQFLVQGHGVPLHLLGLREFFLRRKDAREVIERSSGVGVLLPKPLLANSQRLAMQRFGFG